MKSLIVIVVAVLAHSTSHGELLQSSVRASAPTSVGYSSQQPVDLSSAAGYKWEFKPENGKWDPIRVPAGGWKAQGIKADAGTYRVRLMIPKSASGMVTRLSFAAVNFGAVVLAGPDEDHLRKVAEHLNGWMPFYADLTAIAQPGAELLIEVQVKGRGMYRLANGKYAIAEGASWFSGLADGILRGVSLQVLSPVHVEDIHITTTRSPDLLNVTATISNAEDGPRTVTLSGSLKSWNKNMNRYPHVAPVAVVIPAHKTLQINFGSIRWPFGRKSYWWPNVPFRAGYQAQLHIFSIQVSAGGKVLETANQRFGFREFKVVGDHYELNGVRVNLRGDNQQEADFGTDAYGVKPGFGHPTKANGGWPEAVDNLLRLNFNVMRIHQIPATPYMLDVADEKGLMLVGESPLRGSEHMEDWNAGRVSMLAMDREMVLRDRNHPAIVLWSAANEWAEPMPEAISVIHQVDTTRPVIADGVNRNLGLGIINMEHYVSGVGKFPAMGAAVRSDLPYGETEAIWDADNTLQGFAWMATSIRLRRAKGDADLRNYVLNNAWPNYVPGESPETEILERKVKKMGDPDDWSILPVIADPRNNKHIKLMQQCYAPVAVADLDFDRLNAASNRYGEWPVIKPKLEAGKVAIRSLTVFNDDLFGEKITVKWQVFSGTVLLKQGSVAVRVPLGEQRLVRIRFPVPQAAGDVVLKVQAWKDGALRFAEDKMSFEAVS